MKTQDLDYILPQSAIARFPSHPRDHSRLLIYHRSDGRVLHARFHELPNILDSRYLLIANDVRVLPAKLTLAKATGSRFSGLFLEELSPGIWRIMLRSHGKLSLGTKLDFIGQDDKASPGLHLQLVSRCSGEKGQWIVHVSSMEYACTILDRIGGIPLPPYIQKARGKNVGAGSGDPGDQTSYQTVYANHAGALAAPTAGLHFTPELLDRLIERGVRRAYLTLDVGLGTFLPVQTATLQEHHMHRENFVIPAETVAAIRSHKNHGRPLIVVGTTTVRALESSAGKILDVRIPPDQISASSDLLIQPGFQFQLTDALITNFHLPKSTLLALVAALIGLDKLKDIYAQAIREDYRFYSYGDAMLILP